MRGLAAVVAAPSLLQLTAAQALATGVAYWRWIERVAALIPEPLSDSLQATLTVVEVWLVAPVGAVKLMVGADAINVEDRATVEGGG